MVRKIHFMFLRQYLKYIRESVNSPCRDGANTPISLMAQNSRTLQPKHSMPYECFYTLKVCKIHLLRETSISQSSNSSSNCLIQNWYVHLHVPTKQVLFLCAVPLFFGPLCDEWNYSSIYLKQVQYDRVWGHATIMGLCMLLLLYTIIPYLAAYILHSFLGTIIPLILLYIHRNEWVEWTTHCV